MVAIIILILPLLAYICWIWVGGIDYMQKNHPDYTGDDLFGEWDDDDKTQIG